MEHRYSISNMIKAVESTFQCGNVGTLYMISALPSLNVAIDGQKGNG